MKKLQGIILAIVTSILIAILYWIFESPNIIFLGNLIVLILILIKAKFSYFSIKVLVINYALMAVFFQYNTGKSYGILEISLLELHYLEMNLFIYIYNIITYLWISSTKILEKENELLKGDYKVGTISTYFCCFLAIMTAIIAFPGMPFDPKYLDNRFIGLVQGSAWNHLSIVCLLFVLPKFKKSNLVKITYLFVIFWFISHYERVDIIGILLLSLIYILIKKEKIKLRTYIIVGITGITAVFTMVFLGELRADNIQDMTITDIARKTLVQNTAADVGYVFNTSIEYAETNELLMGKTYITYFIKLVPFLDSNVRAGKILNETYLTPGGEFILSEPLMNFGVIGILLFQILEFSIYSAILSKKNRYRFFLYSFLMLTVFRTSWYGWMYIEKAIVYFIPIIYCITKILDNTERKRNLVNGVEENEGANQSIIL